VANLGVVACFYFTDLFFSSLLPIFVQAFIIDYVRCGGKKKKDERKERKKERKKEKERKEKKKKKSYHLIGSYLVCACVRICSGEIIRSVL